MIAALATLAGLSGLFGVVALGESLSTCRARTTRDREVEAAMVRHPAGSRR